MTVTGVWAASWSGIAPGVGVGLPRVRQRRHRGVAQIRRLLDAGLSTQEIGFLLPCATGAAPDLEPCPELLATLRARLQGLDEQIDTLVRSRQSLRDYLDATERRVPQHHRPCDATTLDGGPERHPGGDGHGGSWSRRPRPSRATLPARGW